MTRIVPFALLVACSIPFAVAQPGISGESPLISLYLPRGFPSAKVQVQYFMTGPFGDYSSFVRPEPDHQTVDFVAAVNGKPADRIKVIAYLPGCELVILEFPLAGTSAWRQLECKPLKTINMRGQILPSSFTQGKAAEVEISYQADWALPFFGICDGLIPTIGLATVAPSENGEFAVDVPDFQSQANLGHAGYAFILREVKTGNILAFLVPDSASHLFNALTVNQSYPPVIRFIAHPPS
jgi:hypothetical protein